MKILSLDLSSKASGYAIIKDRTLITSGVITANQSDPIDRIQKISKTIGEIIQENQDIKAVIIEEVLPSFGSIQKSLHTHKILMYVQAAVNFLVHSMLPNAEVVYLYPSEWRAECGIKNGRGVSRQQQKAYDIAFIKDLFGLDVGDDEADAIGIGIAYTKKQIKEKGEA